MYFEVWIGGLFNIDAMHAFISLKESVVFNFGICWELRGVLNKRKMFILSAGRVNIWLIFFELLVLLSHTYANNDTTLHQISEYQIIEISENVCNLKKQEADWILKIDIVEQGDRLEVTIQWFHS